jgi:hypothetical protein
MSPFASELTSLIPQNLSLAEILGELHTNVLLDTLDGQEPVLVSNANINHFYPKPGADGQSKDKTALQAAIATGNLKCLNAFTLNYPGSDFLAYTICELTNLDKYPVHNQSEICPP